MGILRFSARLSLALGLALAHTAMAQVDLARLDAGMPGPKAQVLVLGTAHLANAAKPIAAASLEPVLQRLAAYQPQVITIEGLPGEQCDLMARYPSEYPPENTSFCVDTAQAKASTGWDIPAAIAQIQKQMDVWPTRPTPAQRRHLAALFLAAGEPASAIVQWLQLPSPERHAGDGLDTALVAQLEKRLASNDESVQIAARLAARLGLQRVIPVDDHTGDNLQIHDEAAFEKAIRTAWNGSAAALQPARKREHDLLENGDLLALYRFINQPATLSAAIAGDFGAAMADPSPQRFGRIYVGGWETRNLRMVANVRAAFRDLPGARVLCIVGASHKPWFDRLLGQMQGVDVVDAEQILAAPVAASRH